jgi:hypothetical protein
MSRYKLRNYQSVYRDPGSVQINALQRQRFQQAFNADDMLAGAVDQMDAADFAGDQELKNQLEQSTRQELLNRSGRGDYETMGMDVAKSARTFDKQYQPIKQNNEAYKGYRASIEKLYDDGKIDAETKTLAVARSRHEYSGLQRNEDGSIDKGSFFQGYNVVNDVDIQELMSEQMKDVAVRRFGNKGKVISQDGNFYITDGVKIESILPDRVEAVYNNLMQDPDVQAALAQKAELRTFQLSDEDIRSRISNTLYGDPENPDSTGLVEQRQSAIDSGKDKEAERLDKIIKEQERLLNDTGGGEDLTDQRRTYLKNVVTQETMNRELNTAIDKFAFKNVEYDKAIDYTQKWTADYNFNLNNYTPNVLKLTEVSQLDDMVGKNTADINSYITLNSDTLTKTVQDANALAAEYLPGGTTLTEQDILYNNVPEDLRKNPTFIEMRSRALAVKKQIVAQQNRLDRAYEETGISDEGKLNTQFGKYTGQELLDTARQTLNDPSLTLIDLINIRNDIGDLYGEQSFLESINPFNTPTKIDPKILQDPSHPDYNRYKRALDVQNMFGSSMSSAALRSLNDLTDAGEADKKEIDNWLEKNSTQTTGTWASNNMPGLTPKEVIQNTKYVKDFFKSTPLDKSFNIFWDGELQRGTGTVGEMASQLGWDSDEVQVKNTLFHTTAAFGEPTLQLTVVGKKDGKNVSKEIILPYSNIRNKQMDQYFNSPGYLLQMEMNLHKHTGAESAQMVVYGPDGKPLENRDATVSFKGNSDKITIFDPTEGKPVTYRIDSPKFSTFINDAAAAGYEIRTKL